tara:strand:- start:4885 stop:5202 length:318 start_codon:yes stop_codon:yes gene_type:complete
MKNVTQEEWERLIENDDKAVVIDSRTPLEWREGIQENALMMDVNQPLIFEKEAGKLQKDKNYYVYCRSGQRSIRACTLLESAGIQNTYNLLGGMMHWHGKVVDPA